MRMCVAEVLVETPENWKPAYPRLPRAQRPDLAKLQKQLRKRRI